MFQEIRDTLGQKAPNSEYQAKTKVAAIIKRVKNLEYSKTSGKPGQSLLIQTEASGEEEWIKLIGKFDALDSSYEGRCFDFLVWPFKPDNSPKSYLYAWIQRQSNDQTPPQARQATNSQNMTQQDALAMLDKLVGWVASMRPPAPPPQTPSQQQQNPEWVGDDPAPPPDDGIPY